MLDAHIRNVFGGKPALWDFLRNVIANLNRAKESHKFLNYTKSFELAMKIYGRWHVCNLFALKCVSPSYSSIERENKKGVKFVIRQHAVLFDCVFNIYIDDKCGHGIDMLIPIILAKDI